MVAFFCLKRSDFIFYVDYMKKLLQYIIFKNIKKDSEICLILLKIISQWIIIT